MATDTGQAVRAGPSTAGTERPGGRRGPRLVGGRLPDVMGLAWVAFITVLVLAPALWHGHSLGPFDLLGRWGLTAQRGGPVHNQVQSDQILLFAPMTSLAWHQVHAGQVPLWNPYNLLGMPVAFDWESAVFSLPMLIGYLVPVSFAYSAVVIVKLLVAGSGMYVLCRVLGLRPLASSFGATVFELSGNVMSYSGWPLTSVLCWFGWIFAFGILLVRGRHRVRDGTLLALAVAFAVYGGYPGSLVLLGMSVVVFFAVHLLWPGAHDGGRGAGGAGRSLLDLSLAGLCGLGLAAPLLLPGVQAGLGSSRRYAPAGGGAYGIRHLPNLLASGLQGVDFRQATYIGVIAVVLVVVGVRFAWRRPAVRPLVLLTVLTMALTFLPQVDRFVRALPGAKVVIWDQAVGPMTFALAVLAAVGFELLVRERRDPRLQRWLLGGFVVTGAIVAGLFAAAEGGLAAGAKPYVRSLVWPAAEVVAGVALAVALVLVRRRRAEQSGPGRRVGPLVAPVFLGVNAAFLLASGTGVWASSPTFFPTTPAVGQLTRAVGDNLVGLGSCSGTGTAAPTAYEIGIKPDTNIAYGVHEFGVYDPILPVTYYRSWKAASGITLSPAFWRLGLFCARITTVAQARLYGISYVLEPAGFPALPGATLDGHAGDETLYKVPAAAQASAGVINPGRAGAGPGDVPVPVAHGDPASWRMAVDAPAAETLWLRLSAVPGWHASVDGSPVGLATWDHGLMFSLHLPPGRHTVTLRYWPTAFTAGIAVALVSGAALAGLGITTRVRAVRKKASTER